MIRYIVTKMARRAGYIPASEINVWDKKRGSLRAFQYSASEREWGQLMMYFEVMYKLNHVPGDIVEYGVSSGISFISFMRILDILEPGRKDLAQRKFYGFDSFEGLPDLHKEHDQHPRHVKGDPQMRKGGYDHPGSYPDLFAFVDKKPNAELIKGWFDDTIPVFFKKNPHVSLAFAHFDADLYESTKLALEYTWDRLTPGGIILFDELNQPSYPGETVAFREFFEDKTGLYTLHALRSMPAKRYLIKK